MPIPMQGKGPCSRVLVPNGYFSPPRNRHGPTCAGSCLPGGEPDPPLRGAVLLDAEVFLPVEEDVYATLQLCCIEELAGWIDAQSIRGARIGHVAPLNEVNWIEGLCE